MGGLWVPLSSRRRVVVLVARWQEEQLACPDKFWKKDCPLEESVKTSPDEVFSPGTF